MSLEEVRHVLSEVNCTGQSGLKIKLNDQYRGVARNLEKRGYLESDSLEPDVTYTITPKGQKANMLLENLHQCGRVYDRACRS